MTINNNKLMNRIKFVSLAWKACYLLTWDPAEKSINCRTNMIYEIGNKMLA